MKFCPIYPILPTTEAATMTYLQQIEHLTYKVNQAVLKVDDLEKKITNLNTVDATGDSEGYLTSLTLNDTTYTVPNNGVVIPEGEDNTLETLTIDGTTWNVPPEGSEVSATSDGSGNLQTITIDGTTYNIEAGGSDVSIAAGADGYVYQITVDGVSKGVATIQPLTDGGGTLTGLVINGSGYSIVPGEGSEVTATGTGGTIETITIDGDTWNVPQGSEVSATGTGTSLETLTIDGVTWDIPTAQNPVVSGVVTFYDAMLHLYAANYNKAGKALTLSLGNISAWSGTTTITFGSISGVIFAPFSSVITEQIVTFSGSDPTIYTIPLKLTYNGSALTLAINPDESGKVCKIEADGTITGYTATAAELKLLSGRTLTFLTA